MAVKRIFGACAAGVAGEVFRDTGPDTGKNNVDAGRLDGIRLCLENWVSRNTAPATNIGLSVSWYLVKCISASKPTCKIHLGGPSATHTLPMSFTYTAAAPPLCSGIIRARVKCRPADRQMGKLQTISADLFVKCGP